MDPYWFPAKRHGWGWGPPSAWQGWAALTLFITLMLAGSYLFPPNRNLPIYLAYACVLAAVLVGVCWFNGEPLQWR